MRWTPLLVAALIVGCSGSDPQVEDPAPEASTTGPTPTSTSTPTTLPSSASTSTSTPVELSEDERAIVAARQAVLDADVMGAEFAETSRARVADMGDTIEVTLLPADPNTIGATAIVVVQKGDLSIVEVRHYR